MKIAVTNATSRIGGGIETYVEELLTRLVERGHKILFAAELDQPKNRRLIRLPEGVEIIEVRSHDPGALTPAISSLKPDVAFSQGFLTPALDLALTEATPVIHFAHTYFGTCVGSTKAHYFPEISSCAQPMGPGCLVQYFPRRCGGLNPWTMMRRYQDERKRLAYLSRCRRILTHSRHMELEYERNGFRGKVKTIPFPVPGLDPQTCQVAVKTTPPPWKLLFLGRMEKVKGGATLLDALEIILRSTSVEIELTMAGDGSEMPLLRSRAIRLEQKFPSFSTKWTGWVELDKRTPLLQEAHLVVVPSLWPEPYGLVGAEACCFGTPAVGFNRGGIPEWLIDEVTGVMAGTGGDPAAQFASALMRVFSGKTTLESLTLGCLQNRNRFAWEPHLDALEKEFELAAKPGVAMA